MRAPGSVRACTFACPGPTELMRAGYGSRGRSSSPVPEVARNPRSQPVDSTSGAVRMRRALAAVYPEIRAGGFSSVDGTVQFYSRVNALLRPGMRVLDFGAGRGKDAVEDTVEYRRALRTLVGKGALIVGADVDRAVSSNPSVDAALVVEEDRGLPLAPESIDIVVCDYVFEHIQQPDIVAAELHRVLKPGGWLCARTPNRWGYIAIGGRVVPNRLHRAALRVLQPERHSHDIFPTEYRMNTMCAVGSLFPPDQYTDCSYFYDCEPVYFGLSVPTIRIARMAFRLLPRRCWALLMVFKQKNHTVHHQAEAGEVARS